MLVNASSQLCAVAGKFLRENCSKGANLITVINYRGGHGSY